MTTIKWKPFGDLLSIHDRINRLFEDQFFQDSEKGSSLASWYPTTDIFETKDEYVLKMEVPGLSKDDVKIELTDNTLTLKGERKEDKEIKKENYHRMESYCGTFCRSFTLPQNVDAKKIDANMRDGILELRIPKAEEKKPRSIPISVVK